jgi:hypothetical protein
VDEKIEPVFRVRSVRFERGPDKLPDRKPKASSTPKAQKLSKPIAVDPGKAVESTFRREEMRWLGEHRKELERDYPGEWVAVEGSRLIAHGRDLRAVLQEAKEKGVEKPFLSGVRGKEWQDVMIIRRWR